MTNKEYMNRAFEISRRIKARKQRLSYLRSVVTSSGQNITDVPKGSPAYSSHMEEQMVRIIDLESSIAEDEKNLVTVRDEIAASISNLASENLISILQMRYLDYMSWEDIMASMDYCRSYLYELHGRALRMIRQKT